jgi:hypothetical protein
MLRKKKENDQHIEAVLKIIKKMNVAAADYKPNAYH